MTGWIFESGNMTDLTQLLRVAVSRGRYGLLAMGAQAQAEISRWSTAEAARGIEAAVFRAVDHPATVADPSAFRQ